MAIDWDPPRPVLTGSTLIKVALHHPQRTIGSSPHIILGSSLVYLSRGSHVQAGSTAPKKDKYRSVPVWLPGVSTTPSESMLYPIGSYKKNNGLIMISAMRSSHHAVHVCAAEISVKLFLPISSSVMVLCMAPNHKALATPNGKLHTGKKHPPKAQRKLKTRFDLGLNVLWSNPTIYAMLSRLCLNQSNRSGFFAVRQHLKLYPCFRCLHYQSKL